MTIKMEHINLHVSNLDRMISFIATAFPEFTVRYDSKETLAERWVHIGDNETYFAIYQATKPALSHHELYSGKPGINHIGLVVDDAEAIRQHLLSEGFEETTIENTHFARKRIYFKDDDGNEWEFTEYLSNKDEERNDYLQ